MKRRRNIIQLAGLSDRELLSEIISRPGEYYGEYERRIELLKINMMDNDAGYSKSSIDSVRTSATGEHSDVTASIAIRRMECETICSEDTKLEDLMKLDSDSEDIRNLIALKRGIILYRRLLLLFSEDVREVIELKLKGYTNEEVAEKLFRCTTYVTDRLSKVKREIDDKASDLIAYMEYLR